LSGFHFISWTLSYCNNPEISSVLSLSHCHLGFAHFLEHVFPGQIPWLHFLVQIQYQGFAYSKHSISTLTRKEKMATSFFIWNFYTKKCALKTHYQQNLAYVSCPHTLLGDILAVSLTRFFQILRFNKQQWETL